MRKINNESRLGANLYLILYTTISAFVKIAGLEEEGLAALRYLKKELGHIPSILMHLLIITIKFFRIL